MNRLVCWRIRLRVRGPLLTTSSAPLGFGVDAPFAKNAAGEYYLAGSLVKGRLKEAWVDLEEMTGTKEWNWERWIGKKPPEQDEDWGSTRGLLQFDDFRFDEKGSSKTVDDLILYRVQMDGETGAVAAQQNLMIHTPFKPGGEYWFTGRARAVVSAEEAADLDKRLKQGLCFLQAVGAETSVGFGVVTGVEVEREEAEQGKGWSLTEGDRWGVALQPEGPLCLAGKRIAGNIFESEAEIAGGVVKGAIANLLLSLHGVTGPDVAAIKDGPYAELCQQFEKIRVLHAKAAKRESATRSGAVPLSSVEVNGEVRDVAISDAITQWVAFPIDWKERHADKEFEIARAPVELRVRTQMDRGKRRAKDEALFAYRMLAAKDSEGTEYHWLGGVDFSSVEESRRAAVKQQLAKLLAEHGVPGVGKLKTRCVPDRIAWTPARPTRQGPSDVFVVVLQTPALLCDAGDLGAGLTDARPVYERYWEWASGGALKQERMFASQSLAGGAYLWKHFQGSRVYRPYVLTDAGSTFVLRKTSPTAEDKLAEWERAGLPLAPQVVKAFQLEGKASDWRKCPYIPQNGYGEIVVNDSWHWEKKL